MNTNIATQILQDSMNSLIKTNYKNQNGFINPSEISADIIANGALAIIRKRNQTISEKNEEDDVSGVDPRQTLVNNLTTWIRSKDSLRDNEEYKISLIALNTVL